MLRQHPSAKSTNALGLSHTQRAVGYRYATSWDILSCSTPKAFRGTLCSVSGGGSRGGETYTYFSAAFAPDKKANLIIIAKTPKIIRSRIGHSRIAKHITDNTPKNIKASYVNCRFLSVSGRFSTKISSSPTRKKAHMLLFHVRLLCANIHFLHLP